MHCAAHIVAPTIHSSPTVTFVGEHAMYRRQFLQTLNFMGVSLILPQSEGYDEDSSIVAPTTEVAPFV